MLRTFHYGILAISVLASCATAAEREVAKGPQPLKYILNMVHHNPGEPLFITKYIKPDYLKNVGYNGDCPVYYIQTALSYERFEKGIVPYESATWHWIQRHAKNLDHDIRMHEEAGLPLYPFTDIMVIPKEIMDKYGSEMRDKRGRLSIQRPMTQQLLRAQIEEIFRRFPAVDGLMTRFGETYLCDTPFHVGGKPAHSAEDHTLLINILRDEICVKRNKKLFYRTWDFGGLHTDPNTYLKATDPVEPHPNLIFSTKYTGADYLRGVPLNKTLGIGKHQRIVEVSMMTAGCYGKGSYPYYIAKGILHGFPEFDPPKGIDTLAREGKIAGLCIWPRGDGWSGPYLSNEFWPDLNSTIMREFARHPGSTDQELFEQYCRTELKLDSADTAKLYTLCLLSADAVFAGIHSKYFNARAWWQRDDKLRDPPGLPSPDRVDYQKILDEKAKMVADWKQIEAWSREINIPDPAAQEYLEVSSRYGRIYFSILEKLWILRVLDTMGVAEEERPKIQRIISDYDALWQEWFTLERDQPSCATLYMTCWPQTWPPTWRESRSKEEVVPDHDTPLIRRYRYPPPRLVSELANPSFESSSLSGPADYKPGAPTGWTGNGIGTIGVLGTGRSYMVASPYGFSWLLVKGKGASVGQSLGDRSLMGKELKFGYLVTRRANENTATDHVLKIVAGTADDYTKGIVLAKTAYTKALKAAGTFNEVSVSVVPSGNPGTNDALWLVLESALSDDSQLHIDAVSYTAPGK